MTVIVFDVAAFRASFPAFANETTYPDVMLEGYFVDATAFISDQVLPRCCGPSMSEALRTRMLYLMTAHLAALGTMIAAGQTPGQVNSSTVDKVSVSLTMPPNPNQWQWWLGLSPYGAQLLALMQAKAAGGFYVGGLPEKAAFRRVGGVFL